MSSHAAIRALLTLLALAQAAGLAAAPDDRVVTLVSDPWPPYVLGQTGGEATGGAGVELLHAIFDRVDGVRLSIPLVPWNRALREVEQGTKDGIGIVLKTPERQVYLDYTEVVFTSHNRIWYSTERFPRGFQWQRYADIKPYALGVVRGHSYGDELDWMIDSGQLTTIDVSSAGQLFAMLDKGRIDLVIVDRLVGSALSAGYDHGARRIVAASKSAAGEIFYIAFSKKSEARLLIPQINRAVAELSAEGVIERLIGQVGQRSDMPDLP